MPVFKQYDEDEVGQLTQSNYAFLEKLWENKPFKGTLTLRQYLTAEQTPEGEARDELVKLGIPIDPETRLVVVDIENPQTNKIYGGKLDSQNEKFYVVMLPNKPCNKQPEEPDPNKSKAENALVEQGAQKAYTEAQAWHAAWYHAISDGGGM